MTNPIRVLLVDDHDLVRAGLRALLERIDDFKVVGEARDGRQALIEIKQACPNVVLMDLSMPELNGLDATAKATSKFPDVRILILSMNAGENYVLPALRAGAAGYLLKNISSTELETAVRAVARGEAYLSSGVSKQLVDRCLQREGDEGSSLERLTPRQREVLQLTGEGRSAKEIATKLDISVRTAEAHRSQLMEALDIHNLAGLVRYAIRMGLVSADT
jgi:DNA-binding NarL/FixJ family response regulator